MAAGEILGATARELMRGAVMGDLAEDSSPAAAAGSIAAGLIPVYGQAADARDTAAALHGVYEGKDGSAASLGFALAGWVPLLGDFIKARRLARTAAAGAAQAGVGVGQGLARGFPEMFPERSIVGSSSLPAGEGYTDKYGNIVYSTRGSAVDQALVLEHEKVHALLSPHLSVLREFRADLRMTLYEKSNLLRYLEEALAESAAQLKVNGIGALPEGLRFPIENGYVELRSVIGEAALGSLAVGGTGYGVYLMVDGGVAGDGGG